MYKPLSQHPPVGTKCWVSHPKYRSGAYTRCIVTASNGHMAAIKIPQGRSQAMLMVVRWAKHLFCEKSV